MSTRMIDRAVRTAVLALALAAPAALANGEKGTAPLPEALKAFVAAYRAAYQGQDLGAALNLFCWAGVDAAKRRTIVGLVERDLARDLVSTRVLGPWAGPIEFVVGGVVNRPNVTVTGHLLAEFAEPGGARHFSLHMIGVAYGAYCIALAVPEAEG